jgi:hypothetical protein
LRLQRCAAESLTRFADPVPISRPEIISETSFRSASLSVLPTMGYIAPRVSAS